MAFSKLKVVVTAAHVVQDADGAQLVPGYVYDVKDAPVIQQLIEDGQLKVAVTSEKEEVKTPSTSTAKNNKDSASADSNPS
jgi:hypothetical protein